MARFFEWDVARDGGFHVSVPLEQSLTRVTLPYRRSTAAGIAHLYEHMVLRANEDVLKALEAAGGSYNAVTSASEVTFHFTSSASGLGFDLETFFRTEFTAEELEVERATILEERVLTPDDDDGVSRRLLGTADDIAAFSLASLSGFVEGLNGARFTVTYGEAPGDGAVRQEAAEVSYDCFSSSRCVHEGQNGLEFSDDPTGQLAAFLLHVAQCGAPAKLPDGVQLGMNHRPLTDSDLDFLARYKPHLWFRYRLGLEEIMTLDSEFVRFLRTVGRGIDVKQAFLEVPWEAELRRA